MGNRDDVNSLDQVMSETTTESLLGRRLVSLGVLARVLGNRMAVGKFVTRERADSLANCIATRWRCKKFKILSMLIVRCGAHFSADSFALMSSSNNVTLTKCWRAGTTPFFEKNAPRIWAEMLESCKF